ncbi:MAG: hypothetical protein FH751_03085 [Firmicutes bacterium]|nr:hypothetical protein [Bacillota bacterium]
MLNEKVLFYDNTKDYSLKKEYKSKNKVQLIGMYTANNDKKYYVKKSISNHKKMLKEIDILGILNKNKLTVPKVLFEQESSYIREYIEGKNLLFLLNDFEKKQNKKFCYSKNETLIYNFLEWIDKFYYILEIQTGEKIILNDMDLTNFILNDKGIYGLDFEMCKRGEKERDMGMFLSNILTLDNPFTNWKIRFTRQVLKRIYEYGYDLNLVRKEIYKGLDDKKIPDMLRLLKK